jgi:hypothetical protein
VQNAKCKLIRPIYIFQFSFCNLQFPLVVSYVFYSVFLPSGPSLGSAVVTYIKQLQLAAGFVELIRKVCQTPGAIIM